jgi:hypothetical protein
MQFGVDTDTGDIITAWITLDHPDAIPTISVSAGNAPPKKLEPKYLRAGVKARGLHNSGMVGFRIDKTNFPGVEKAANLEIRNNETNLVIYRRPRKHDVKQKLFRLELQGMPQTQLELQISKHFSLSYHAVERHPYETLKSVIGNKFAQSIYVSGRPSFSRYGYLLSEYGFKMATVLRDPYEELAERFLFIRYASSNDRPDYIADHMTGFEPLIDIAKNFDITSDDSLRSTFEGLNDAQRKALTNPFVRALTCDVDEWPEPHHVGLALENLATFDVVGLYSRYDTFKSMVHDLLGTNAIGDFTPVEVSWAPMMAAKLAQIPVVTELLALDIEFYEYARDAIEKVLQQR